MADGTAGATRRDPRREQAHCFMQILVQPGVGGESFATPEAGCQPREHRRIHFQKTLDSARGTKDSGKETSRIVLISGRRQPALKEPAGNLPKQLMLRRDSCFRE